MRLVLVALFAVACGYPAPKITARDSAVTEGIIIDGVVTCETCFIAAVSPDVANPGATLYLEGTFVDDLPITFPGGSRASLVMTGPHRATVVVPAAATCGDVSLDTGSSAPFCAVPYTLGLGPARTIDEQASGGRAMSVLVPGRDHYSVVRAGARYFLLGGNGPTGAISTVDGVVLDGSSSISGSINGVVGMQSVRCAVGAVHIGSYVYAIGGYSGADISGTDGPLGGMPSATVERALIKSDGTLAAFQADSSTLRVARHSYALVVIGNYVYAIGGFGASFTPLDSVERALINKDGTIGAFDLVPNVVLNGARGGLSATVVGNNLYLIGGSTTPYSSSTKIERAPIQGDGSLDPIVDEGSLTQAHNGHAAVLLGDALYVIGGTNNNVIEKATVQTNGTLTAFANAGASTYAGFVPPMLAGDALYQLSYSNTRMTINASGDVATFGATAGGLTEARANFVGVAIGGYYYVIGGEVGGVPTSSIERAPINPDGTLGAFATWSQALPIPVSHSVGAIVDGKIFCIFGGATTSGLSTQATCGYIGIGGFAGFNLGPALTIPGRRDATVVVSGSYVYLMGGSDTNGPTKSIERIMFMNSYPQSTTTIATQLGAARVGATAVVAGPNLYVLGGTVGGVQVATTEHAALNGATLGAFSPGADLSSPRAFAGQALVGTNLYLVGGTSSNAAVSTVERAPLHGDNTLGGFAAVSGVSLATARANHALAITGNYLTAIGGGVTTVEQAPLK